MLINTKLLKSKMALKDFNIKTLSLRLVLIEIHYLM